MITSLEDAPGWRHLAPHRCGTPIAGGMFWLRRLICLDSILNVCSILLFSHCLRICRWSEAQPGISSDRMRTALPGYVLRLRIVDLVCKDLDTSPDCLCMHKR